MSDEKQSAGEGPQPTIESVYGKPLEQLTPPAGWEFTGEFRPNEPHEDFLSDAGCFAINTGSAIGQPRRHYLILRRKPEPSLTVRITRLETAVEALRTGRVGEVEPLEPTKPAARRWVLEETGEVREPKAGDWALCSGLPTFMSLHNTPYPKVPILRLVEKPE